MRNLSKSDNIGSSNNNDNKPSKNNDDDETNVNAKRPLTLDLNKSVSKLQRFNQSQNQAPVLSTPDLNMLKLASPELENLILNNNSALVTPSMFQASKVSFFE